MGRYGGHMASTHSKTGRRSFLATGIGAAALVGLGRDARAAEPTAVERANMKVVEEFCAAWPSHDLERILGFFAPNGAYRMTETMEPAKGREALTARIKTIITNVDEFKILDTWARGPMVVNERVDRFSNFVLKSWHGVGIFFIKDGKIVEWYDYTIDSVRT
jgi:limonene-1,2-epoxide hydrolase